LKAVLYLLTVLITSSMFAAAFAIGRRLFRRILHLQMRKPITSLRPDHWDAIVDRNIPMASNLNDAERSRLLEIVHDLVATRHWEGCGGLDLTEDIQVSIAAQAAILVLGFSTPPYPQVDSILVYPSTFAPRKFSWTPSSDDEERVATLGEAWRHGVVILSWDAARAGATNPFDGQNVVFHEFAHQLDSEDGAFDGVPPLRDRSAYQPWTAMLEREYEELVRAEEQGLRTVLQHYGATNRAEFFAVASEAFFEKPVALLRKQPELYQEFVRFYRQDPAAWPDRRSSVSSPES
jgi:Mlc titration factor MtfA (ptsG expression regulator)